VAGGSAILAIKIIADANSAIKEFDKLGKKTGGFEAAIGAAAIPAATVVTGLGAMTVAAAKDAGEQAKLAKVYENATGSTEDYSGAINEAVQAGRAKAFTDTAVRNALAPLVTATGDAEEANKLLGPALDIARLAGVDAATAAEALAKAHEGQNRQLQALIPGMERVKDPTEQIAIATALAAGAAETYAASAPGQLLAVSDAYLELGETIGSTFLPVLQTLTDLAQASAGFLREHMDIVQPLAVFFGVLAGAILAVNVAMGILALLTSPVSLFILAILAIGAGLIMLYQRSQLFRDIISTVFDIGAKVVGTMGDAIVILGGVAQTVFDAIDLVVTTSIDAMQAIFAGILSFLTPPFEGFQTVAEGVFSAVSTAVGTAIDAIALIFAGILAWLRVPFESFQTIAETVWSAVQTAASTAIGAISTIFSTVQAMLTGPFEAFQTVVQGVFDAIVGIARTAIGIIEGIIQGISDAIKTVSDAVDAINPLALPPPSAGGGGGSVSAMGARSTALSRGRAAEGGGGNMTVNVYGGDPWRIEQAVKRGFRGWTNNSGGNAPTREY
jgi:hypothetical protein